MESFVQGGVGHRVVRGEDSFGLKTGMALRLAREEAVHQATQLFQLRDCGWNLVGEMGPTQRNEVGRSQLVSEGFHCG